MRIHRTPLLDRMRQLLGRRLVAATSDEAGATLIEMGVVLPVFFLMLFGFFNFMFILFGICNANFAAMAGARYASLHSTTSASPATVAQVKSVMQSNLYTMGGGTPTLAVNYTGTGNTVGQPVNIGISYVAAPGMGIKNFTVTAQAYRYITH